MILEHELSICEDAKKIIFRYVEKHYPLRDTGVILYDDAYKLNIMLSDGLAAILNDRNDIYNTFSGDLLFFSPAEIHHGRILRQGVHKYIEILIPTEYFPDFKAYHSLFSDTTEKRTNLLSPKPNERTIILSLAEKILSKITNNFLDNDVFLFADLIELLKIFVELYNCGEENNNQNIPATLETAIRFIREEYSESINLSDIAAISNCSSSYLSRIFKKHIGKSPYCYLTEYRLFVAEKLLRSGNSVTEVAAMCGFADASAFIKCFKKSFGMTPLKYRNMYQTQVDV